MQAAWILNPGAPWWWACTSSRSKACPPPPAPCPAQVVDMYKQQAFAQADKKAKEPVEEAEEEA